MRLLLAATFFHFLLLLAALPRRRWRCCRRSLLGLLSLSGSGSRGLCWWVARGSRGTAWAGTAVAGVAACPSRGFLFSCHWSFSGGDGGSCCYVRYYTVLDLKNFLVLNECSMIIHKIYWLLPYLIIWRSPRSKRYLCKKGNKSLKKIHKKRKEKSKWNMEKRYSQVPNKQVGPNKRIGWLFWANFMNE